MKPAKRSWFDPIQNWYARFERPISSISLIGGFIFDSLTLQRVDMFWENFWVVIHFLVVGVCIIVMNRGGEVPLEQREQTKLHFWLLNILQFFFGGLLSTFLVFYFRSGSLFVSWPFVLVLALAFMANERLKHHFARLIFQISFLFLSLYLFTIFLIPIVIHSIGAAEFVLSGIAAVMIFWLFWIFFEHFTKQNFGMHKRDLLLSIGSILLVVNILYFTNIIPPIPLSLKDAGVYHTITKDAFGDHELQPEDNGWFGNLAFFPDFHVAPGDPVYIYSAVFSPSSLNTTIVHNWQRYDGKNRWIDMGKISLTLIGGRDGGYRTYSMKENLPQGKWRVNVETSRGQIIGRVLFTIVSK